jgi:hypothetical protein
MADKQSKEEWLHCYCSSQDSGIRSQENGGMEKVPSEEELIFADRQQLG